MLLTSLIRLQRLRDCIFMPSDARQKLEKLMIQQKIDEKLQEQQNYSKEMGFTLGMDGSKQNVARAQTQYSNLLVDMETQFGEENDQ